jgi:hypothetical protein
VVVVSVEEAAARHHLANTVLLANMVLLASMARDE